MWLIPIFWLWINYLYSDSSSRKVVRIIDSEIDLILARDHNEVESILTQSIMLPTSNDSSHALRFSSRTNWIPNYILELVYLSCISGNMVELIRDIIIVNFWHILIFIFRNWLSCLIYLIDYRVVSVRNTWSEDNIFRVKCSCCI